MLNDLRYTIRTLLRARGFTASACLVIAFGVGVNVAVFSVADAALLRPLPYKDPDQLVNVYQMMTTVAGERVDTQVQPNRVGMLRQFTHIFEAIEVVRFGRQVALETGIDQTSRIGGFAPGLPPLLGIRPQIGRAFTVEDVAAATVVVLSDAYWTRAYGRDPRVIGGTLRFQGRSHTIVGVMPANFRYFAGGTSDAWLPIDDQAATDVAGRLRPGLSIQEAQRQLDEAVARAASPRRGPEFWVRAADWRRTNPPPSLATSRMMLRAVVAASILVLVIACANVANLLTQRTVAREREIAIRLSVGAARSRVARLVITEALLITCVGGVVALVTASWAVETLSTQMPPSLAAGLLAFSLPTTGWRLRAFGAGTALCTGLLLGTIPALRAASWSTVCRALSIAQRNVVPTRAQRRVAHIFQAGQLALTLVLLIGAGLLVTSATRLLRMPDGFEPSGLLHVSVGFPKDAFTPAKQSEMLDELTREISVLPGALDAVVGPPPVSDGVSTNRWEPLGHPEDGVVLHAQRFAVGSGFFRVAGMTLEQGRTFTPGDRQSAERIIIITRNAARRLWRGRSPIGQQLMMSDGGRPYTVVGVLRDLKIVDVEFDGVEMFVPARASASAVLVRFDRDAPALARAIRQLVQRVDSRLTVQRLVTVDYLRSENDPLGYSRFLTVLLTSFAVLGLGTSMMGFYGVTAFGVTRRTREVGTRMALGADAQRIVRLFMREVCATLLGGLLLGLAAARVLTKVIALRLFGVSAHDPVVWSGAVALVVLLSLAVTLNPIRRVTRLAPYDALRLE